MDNKNELFDLNREKRELDAFLSKIAEAEPSVSLPLKGAVQTQEALSSLAVNKSAFEAALPQEPSGLKLEKDTVKPEGTSIPFAHKDKLYAPSVNEFIPRFSADTVSLDRTDQADSAQDKMSSLMSLDEAKKTEAPLRRTDAQGVKPLESFKTMTRFDGTTKSDEHMLAETPLSEEKKILTEIETEKKIDKASPYDYTPEKKSVGKGKWLWVLIVLLILVLIGYFWFSSKSSITGVGSFFKTNQNVASSSVKDIKLLSIRQRLVYNIKLGRSIRVIEGIAENSASYPVSKIKIAANLYDANGSLLASMESFGGNILIDAKLETLDAAALIADLNKGNASEDRIPPKGQTPFMVIFTSDLAGVHKLSVLPVDFKKSK
jgi:Protein of unknown function (DUF3426)